jgi:hypothetical protein
MQHLDTVPASSTFAVFAAAVAVVAASFALTYAEARQSRSGDFYVAYQPFEGGPTVHSHSATHHRHALHRFEAAVIQDNLAIS